MGKLFDHAIGSDAHIALEVSEDGKLGLEVSYSVEKLHAPVTAFLQKITAKVPFIQKRVPFLVNGVFSQLGVALGPKEDIKDVEEVEPKHETSGPAAHEAAPIEPAAPQV